MSGPATNPPEAVAPGAMPGERMDPAALFWRVKLRLARNHLGDFRRLFIVHLVVGLGVVFALLGGGYLMFKFIFEFLLDVDNQPFGEPLMKRLIGMVLLAFFSMLTFSNLVIMLTTSYISREVEFLIAQPISHRRLFFCKLGESTIYSSWAFTILSMPFFTAIIRSHPGGGGASVYAATAAMLVPYVLIPSALGAIATLLLTAFFPARKSFRFALALGALSVVGVVVGSRIAGISGTIGPNPQESIGRVMKFMSVGDIAWMPSTWVARGIRSSLAGEWSDSLFWWAMLASTSLMTLQVCYWLAGPLYYRGYCGSRTSGSARRTREGGLYRLFDTLARPLPSPLRALVAKDFTIFWRDPAQWGQLVMLFGLLFIYIANLRGAAQLNDIPLNRPFWQGTISLFNIGAICFVLSILSTRFFYPMLSLEGKQQWVIGLAPLGRTTLVWVKYGVCWGCAMGLTLPLVVFSCSVLRADPFIIVLSLVTAVVMSMGLSSLAIGLGALMPNFSEDNPSRIANGIGGTINVLLSMAYIFAIIVLEVPAVALYVNPDLAQSGPMRVALFASIPLWIVANALAITVPMYLGLRNWRRLEF